MGFNWDKPFTTRDGKEVRIYAHGGAGPHSVHGAILTMIGWKAEQWSERGVCNTFLSENDESSLDLVNTPIPLKLEPLWGVVIRNRDGTKRVQTYYSEDAARMSAYNGSQTVAVVKIEVTGNEGDGL